MQWREMKRNEVDEPISCMNERIVERMDEGMKWINEWNAWTDEWMNEMKWNEMKWMN